MNPSANLLNTYAGSFHLLSAFLLVIVSVTAGKYQKTKGLKLQGNLKAALISFILISICEALFCFISLSQFPVLVFKIIKSLSLLVFITGGSQWFLYIMHETGCDSKRTLLIRLLIYIPVFCILALNIFAGENYFSIVYEDKSIVKGELFIFWYLITTFYFIGASAIALIFKKGKDISQNRQKVAMSLFPLPFFILFLLDKTNVFQFKEAGITISVIFYFIFRMLDTNIEQQKIMTQLTTEIQDEKKKLAVANVQAESANYAKSAFLFNMSHDVRTPLNAITGYTAMAMKYIDDKSRVSECIEKINSSGKQLLKLMNRVLDMSRIESGDVCINEEPLDIVSLYKNAVAANQEAAHFRNITLQFEAKNIVSKHVYADEVNINQIVNNIVGNAIKYSEPGGTVRCCLHQNPCEKEGIGTYIFTTEDTGIGMSKEFISHIFEVFSREKTSTLSGKAGVGLGMSVVKRIVDKMGGEVNVSSELGNGTSVDVSLNFRTIQNDIKVRTFDPDAQDLNGRRVLIVEDNEMNREIAKDILEDNGMIVEEAEDGTVAVEKVIETTESNGPFYYDFILMDIQMPNMNGYDAAKAIRAISALDVTHLPIIAMTANAFEDDRRKSFESGMDAHLAKPIDVDELFMTLKIFLR